MRTKENLGTVSIQQLFVVNKLVTELYQKIRDNGPKSWWRCQDRSCNGRLCMDDDIVINVSGIHHHPPNKAKITAQTVIRKMRKRAIEETTSIPKI